MLKIHFKKCTLVSLLLILFLSCVEKSQEEKAVIGILNIIEKENLHDFQALSPLYADTTLVDLESFAEMMDPFFSGAYKTEITPVDASLFDVKLSTYGEQEWNLEFGIEKIDDNTYQIFRNFHFYRSLDYVTAE